MRPNEFESAGGAMPNNRGVVFMLHRGGARIRGSEICVIEAAHALATAGYRVVVLRHHGVMDELLRPWVTALVDFDFPELMLDGLRSEMPFLRYTRALMRLHRLMREWSPAIVYTSGGLPCQLGVPAARMMRVPLLCHFHHPAIKRAYYLWLVKFADGWIFPSEYTRLHSLEKAGLGGNVVYNGVDPDLFRPLPHGEGGLRERLGVPPDAIVVGQVGALVPHKRPQLLLRAFSHAAAQVPSLYLCLVGDGPLEDALRAEVATLGLQGRVLLTGFVESVLPYYQQVIDINVLASVEEGLGISVLEGSACALPALIADSTGLRETVEPDATGLTFAPDDGPALTELILKLARDGELRGKLGRAGRKLVERKFSLAAYHAGVLAAVARISLGEEQTERP